MESRRLSTVHSVYTLSFVSEILTCSVVSLEKFKLHILSQKVVSFILLQHFKLYLLIMFPHTGTQLYLLTMSFNPQPTNKQTLRCRAELRKPQNLTNTRQYGKTFRVEFTLTKLQEDLPEQESSRQITRAHKNFKKSNGNRIPSISDKTSQADQRQGSAKVV